MVWFVVFVIFMFISPPIAIVVLLIGVAYALFVGKKK